MKLTLIPTIALAICMSAATNATILADDPKLAYGLIETAMMVKDRQLKEIELRQKKEDAWMPPDYLKNYEAEDTGFDRSAADAIADILSSVHAPLCTRS